jgi:hypothetical protein
MFSENILDFVQNGLTYTANKTSTYYARNNILIDSNCKINLSSIHANYDWYGPHKLFTKNFDDIIHTNETIKPYMDIIFIKPYNIRNIFIIDRKNDDNRFRDFILQAYDINNNILYTSNPVMTVASTGIFQYMYKFDLNIKTNNTVEYISSKTSTENMNIINEINYSPDIINENYIGNINTLIY